MNLLLFPGGGASLDHSSPFFDSAKWMFEVALDMNMKGDRFPVHGTCLGFELLHVILANTTEVYLPPPPSFVLYYTALF